MVRLGGSATQSHFDVFQGLETIFRRRGIDLDWVLYSDYDAMVDAFVNGDIDLASQIESAFLSITGSDEVEEVVLRGEACSSFVPGIEHGWDLIEAAAVDEGLV